MKFLHHPTVARALSDPRALDAFVAALRLRDRAVDALGETRRRAAQAMGLATAQEIRDLKTVIRDLERRLRER
jgi:hypothetical protein